MLVFFVRLYFPLSIIQQCTRMKIKLVLTLCLVCALPLQADTTIKQSINLLNFNYEEFDESGNSYNTEKGVIPGISISILLSGDTSNYTHSAGFEAYNGLVDYEGETQAGLPHTTDTDEAIYRLFYKLNWLPKSYNTSLYGKITWQQWDRDILPTRTVFGLFEQYQWWAYELGFSVPLYEDDLHTWLFDLGATRTNNGTIVIDLSRHGFGKPELNLSNGSGFSAALHYKYTISARSGIEFNLQHQRWTFGRSNTKTISNGRILINITEPRSVSNYSLVSLTYRYHF